jgi:hypothetical protein
MQAPIPPMIVLRCMSWSLVVSSDWDLLDTDEAATSVRRMYIAYTTPFGVTNNDSQSLRHQGGQWSGTHCNHCLLPWRLRKLIDSSDINLRTQLDSKTYTSAQSLLQYLQSKFFCCPVALYSIHRQVTKMHWIAISDASILFAGICDIKSCNLQNPKSSNNMLQYLRASILYYNKLRCQQLSIHYLYCWIFTTY